LYWKAVAFIASGFLMAACIAFDLRAHKLHMAVINVVWAITALYFGPFGWLADQKFGWTTPGHASYE
jgi:hypothetical protein